jgi:hypothetical protein
MQAHTTHKNSILTSKAAGCVCTSSIQLNLKLNFHGTGRETWNA